MPIRTAAAMPGTAGWMMAVELDDGPPPFSHPETILTRGRYVAALNRVDCEGCAAAVESAVQQIRGVGMAGVSAKTSMLVFEIVDGARVHLVDIQATLSSVSQALKTVIALSGLRGPMPVMFSAA